jgi:hypothetical protein
MLGLVLSEEVRQFLVLSRVFRPVLRVPKAFHVQVAPSRRLCHVVKACILVWDKRNVCAARLDTSAIRMKPLIRHWTFYADALQDCIVRWALLQIRSLRLTNAFVVITAHLPRLKCCRARVEHFWMKWARDPWLIARNVLPGTGVALGL